MSNSVINDVFGGNGGVHTPYKPTPLMPVSQFGTPTGKVDTFKFTDQDLLKFTVPLNFYTAAEWQAVRNFYLQHFGGQDSFLFLDPIHYTVAEYTAIAAWAAEDTFQLVDTLGTQTFNRYNIVPASEVIKYDGTAKVRDTHYSIVNVDSGVVTFIADPGAGEAVTASMQFYRRCLFDANSPGGGFDYVLNEEEKYDIVLNFFEIVPSAA